MTDPPREAGDRPRRLLAFDVAGEGCGVAVWADGDVAAARDEPMRRGQAERLVPAIEAVLSDAGLSHAALDAVAATVGPGAFTGVRIGLATVRGLALALGVPAVGVTTFEAVRAGLVALDRPVAVVINAKRADIYAQVFAADGTALNAPEALAPAALDARLPAGPVALAGDGLEQARPALAAAGRDVAVAEGPARPDPAVLARLVANRPLPPPGTPPPRPLYLRPPDVTPPAGASAAPS